MVAKSTPRAAGAGLLLVGQMANPLIVLLVEQSREDWVRDGRLIGVPARVLDGEVVDRTQEPEFPVAPRLGATLPQPPLAGRCGELGGFGAATAEVSPDAAVLEDLVPVNQAGYRSFCDPPRSFCSTSSRSTTGRNTAFATCFLPLLSSTGSWVRVLHGPFPAPPERGNAVSVVRHGAGASGATSPPESPLPLCARKVARSASGRVVNPRRRGTKPRSGL